MKALALAALLFPAAAAEPPPADDHFLTASMELATYVAAVDFLCPNQLPDGVLAKVTADAAAELAIAAEEMADWVDTLKWLKAEPLVGQPELVCNLLPAAR